MKTTLLSVLALGFFMTAGAQATTTANHNVTLALTDAIELIFTAGGSGVTMSFTTPDNYQNGVTSASAATLQVRSNRLYNVSVKAAAANFTVGGVASTMPVNGVLAVKEHAQASYTALSTTNASLLASQPRGITTFSVDYQATPGFAYPSGNYVANIIYTATQQ